MAEEKKNNDVELDTDDVQETSINFEGVDTDSEKHASEIKKEDVDLGYTDISSLGKDKAENKKETEEEDQPKVDLIQQKETESENKKTDDLSKVSDNAQKRIKELTFKYRESERREKAALEYAKGLQKKYSDVSEKYEHSDTEYLKQYDARIDAERDKVKRQLKDALDNQDTDQVMEANDSLTRLAVEKEKVRISLSEKDRLKKEAETASKEQATVEQNIAQRTPVISPKARTWAQDNSWFGQDRVLTSAAMGLHDELLSQGFDVESDDYYNEINKRMKDYFPSKFANAEETVRKENSNNRPVQAVAGVSRKQGGRRTVTLTKSQVAIAKKLGVPLEEYAKFVKEER
jgi:hypothetical protein